MKIFRFTYVDGLNSLLFIKNNWYTEISYFYEGTIDEGSIREFSTNLDGEYL